jgi:hypothetical protein
VVHQNATSTHGQPWLGPTAISRLTSIKHFTDKMAEMSAGICHQRLLTIGHLTPVKPNYKFWRRLAGLANGDLRRDDI